MLDCSGNELFYAEMGPVLVAFHFDQVTFAPISYGIPRQHERVVPGGNGWGGFKYFDCSPNLIVG